MLDFVVIGSQKCGTTWLFDRLKMHPRIYFPVGKEGNYWNYRFYINEVHRNIYHSAMNGPVVDLCHYICGDITPDYAIMSLEQIQNLQRHHPNLELVLMVRHPIERAWSAIKMTYQYHGLDLAKLTEEQIVQALTTDTTAELSRYDLILDRWLAVFDPAQLHILFFDDLSTHYREILAKCCHAIGAEPQFFEQIPDSVLATVSMPGTKQALAPQVYNCCIDFYASSIRSLADHTGRNLDRWLQPRLSVK